MTHPVKITYSLRTGKSYLLNRLLNRQDGFVVGPTINPCTKGRRDVENSDSARHLCVGKPCEAARDRCYIGIGGYRRNSFSSARPELRCQNFLSGYGLHLPLLTQAAILLSSYFIYNSMGVIDESALSCLSLVVNLTKHISTKSTLI